MDGRTSVLLVDDEESFHRLITRHLSGCRVIRAYNGAQTLAALEEHHVDVLLLDLNLPDCKGLDLLQQIKRGWPSVEIVVVTAHSELSNAVEAVKLGAFEFLAKTYESYCQLPQCIDRALENRRRRRQSELMGEGDHWLRDTFELLETSRAETVQRVMSVASRVAATPLTVLLEGESGVGKEVLARYLHMESDRADRPFVAVNLSAIPSTLLEAHLFGHVKGAFTGADNAREGKFEQADGGTLFLDEIGELDVVSQAKILRVLQEREVERVGAKEPATVDVRVIAASNRNLMEAVAKRQFREDLFHRLNVVRLEVPPLRARRLDLARLVELLVKKHSSRLGRAPLSFTQSALKVLRTYEWPGNVRELENLIMRLVAIHPGDVIDADDIPPEFCLPTLNELARRHAAEAHKKDGGRLYFLAREQFERYLVRLMLARCNNNRRETARALGIGLSTVKEKLRGAGYDDWTDELEDE